MFAFANPVPTTQARRSSRLGVAAVLALLLVTVPAFARDVAAKAPPLVTTVLATEILATPDIGAPAIASVPEGFELELTGSTEPGFLEVYYDGATGWVPAQYLTLGQRPGIDTAVATEVAPILDAPLRDANALGVVPKGDSVLLTGASLNGYDAASHEGVGGWINERLLER